MKKYASTLAKEHNFNNENDYFNYIVESLINGQRSQVRFLFNQMKKDDQKTFLIDFLDVKICYHKSVLNICISELLT